MATARWFYAILITCAACTPLAASERTKELDAAFDSTRTAVVRVVASSKEGKVSQGSAVLLKKVTADGGQSYGYFVSCAHVIEGTSRASLYHFGANSEVANADVAEPGKPIQFLADCDHDLAILRVQLRQPDRLVEVEIERTLPEARSTAYGLGFGIFAVEHLHVASMQVGTTVSASNYLTADAKDRFWQVLQATRDPLASGMSGGPLIAKSEQGQYKLVGVLFATDHNGAELTVPAQFIVPLLNQALEKKDGLDDLAKKAVEIRVPFSKEIQERLGRLGYRDQIDWAGLSSWIEAFTTTMGFRERFQEVVIDDFRKSEPAAGRLTLHVNSETVQEDERVEIWVNGHRATFSRKDAKWDEELGDYLVGGENLLMARKVAKSRKGGVYELNDLVRTNSIEFTLQGEAGVPYVVNRSLPALVDRFTLYVTVRRPEEKRDAQLRTDDQIRLAVRVDAIERFLNGVPFLLPVAENLIGPEGKLVARAKADMAFAPWNEPEGWKPRQFVRLDVRRGQSLDLSIRGQVANLASDVAGIQLGFEDASQKLPFEFRSRLQFVRERAGPFHVVMRATAATSDGDFKVPLLSGGGARVNADLAGLVTELGLQWLNNRFLKPEEPRLLARERLGKLLSEIGGSGKSLDDSVTLRRAFLAERDDGWWLVATFGVENTQSESPALPLLPPVGDGRIIDLVGRQVSGALAAEFARLGRVKQEVPRTGTMSQLAFWLKPPGAWWDYPEATDPLQDRDTATRVVEGMTAAWKQLLTTGEVGLRIGERELIGLLLEPMPGVQWKPGSRNIALTLNGGGSSFSLTKEDRLEVEELELSGQKVKANKLELKELEFFWKGDETSTFSGHISAKEIHVGSPGQRLNDVSGVLSVTAPVSGDGPTSLQLANPEANVRLSDVEFSLKAGQGPWKLKLSRDGQLSGTLRVELNNDAGQVEFTFQQNRVQLRAVDLDLSRVKGVKDKINGAINKAIGFNVDMDLDRLRIDTQAMKLTVHLTLKKRIRNDFPRIDEEVKLHIREEFDLRQTLKAKKIEWKVKLGSFEKTLAEFHLPMGEIRKVVDLDAVLGEGWDK